MLSRGTLGILKKREIGKRLLVMVKQIATAGAKSITSIL